MKIFIQNESGSRTKHHHNEKTLEPTRTSELACPYPFPYGFVLATTAEDGGNVDCYVVTRRPLHAGDIVDCEPLALLEQFEGAVPDHSVIAVFPGEEHLFDPAARQALADFINRIFENRPEKKMRLGGYQSREDALRFVAERVD